MITSTITVSAREGATVAALLDHLRVTTTNLPEEAENTLALTDHAFPADEDLASMIAAFQRADNTDMRVDSDDYVVIVAAHIAATDAKLAIDEEAFGSFLAHFQPMFDGWMSSTCIAA